MAAIPARKAGGGVQSVVALEEDELVVGAEGLASAQAIKGAAPTVVSTMIGSNNPTHRTVRLRNNRSAFIFISTYCGCTA